MRRSLPAYQSPIRHHQRTASRTTTVKVPLSIADRAIANYPDMQHTGNTQCANTARLQRRRRRSSPQNKPIHHQARNRPRFLRRSPSSRRPIQQRICRQGVFQVALAQTRPIQSTATTESETTALPPHGHCGQTLPASEQLIGFDQRGDWYGVTSS